MSTYREGLYRLREAMASLERDRAAIEHRIAGLQMAIDVYTDADESAPVRAERGSIKSALIDLLKEAGSTGLNARSAVEMGKARGVELDRQTVASLLSRMKRDSMVTYDGERYRLILAARERKLKEPAP